MHPFIFYSIIKRVVKYWCKNFRAIRNLSHDHLQVLHFEIFCFCPSCANHHQSKLEFHGVIKIIHHVKYLSTRFESVIYGVSILSNCNYYLLMMLTSSVSKQNFPKNDNQVVLFYDQYNLIYYPHQCLIIEKIRKYYLDLMNKRPLIMWL